MDTDKDFTFLNENIATRFNPFQEGEYIVIQTYPVEKSLRASKRYLGYQEAERYCNLENLAHDYTSFGVRLFHQEKLWNVDFEGNPSTISKQQDWKIAEIYLEAHYDRNTDEELILCSCSYPYFYALKHRVDRNGCLIDYWQNVTCLIGDKGRDIEFCPNCNSRLIEEEDLNEDIDFGEEESRPQTCIGCDNYHGQKYGENFLICAIHPHGWQGEDCPDFLSQ